MLVSLIAMGLYQLQQRMSFREVVVRLVVGVSLGSLAVIGICHTALPASLSNGFVCVAAIYALPVLILIRLYFVRNVDRNIFRRKTLIYGSGARAASITALRRQADRRGFKVVGNVPARDESGRNRELLQTPKRSMLDIALESGADEIVIAVDDRREKLPMRELLDCRLHGIGVIDVIEFLERETGKIRVDLVSPGWFIFSEGFRKSWLSLITKRVTDVVSSTTAFFIGWPVLLAVALAIKIEDGWRSPVLYRQLRVGHNGQPFGVFKFRSMVVDAEADGRAVWATKDDHRVTKVGQFIRKLRIDELPQIFNVICGQMSIVGPRPERPEFVEHLSAAIPYYAERHSVKPGITGWAQLRYSYGASERDAIEKLQYDLYYVKNRTLFLDLLIIIQTAEVVLWGKGAR
jgi:sugar transferase (PEP-CTERM system associated)